MPHIIPISENTLFIEFEQVMNAETNDQVHQVYKAITTQLTDRILDTVPAYASIHLTLKTSSLKKEGLKGIIVEISNIIDSIKQSGCTGKVRNKVSVPVYYGEEVAPDLKVIAQTTNLPVNEIISLHTASEYRVYAVGFLPGFPYLGSVSPKIATTRKAEPRKHVPAGSVGIAGQQTGIYPVKSPGGWQIIGRTPLSLITTDEAQPNLIQIGDSVSFKPIEKDEFIALGGDLTWD